MIDSWFPFLDDHLLNHEAQLEVLLALPYSNKVSEILHPQLLTLRLIYQTSRLMIESKDCIFPSSRLYIENVRTKQYSQYVHSLLDFGSPILTFYWVLFTFVSVCYYFFPRFKSIWL